MTADRIIERRIAEIMKSFGQQTDKVNKALKLMPKRKGKAATGVQSKRQIDFRTFYEEFYKKKIARNMKLCKISSNVAWSEIRTKIKGSSFEYFEKTQGLSYNCNDAKVASFVKNHYFSLQSDERISRLVFEIFESYELWKIENDYFDIEDFVGLFYRKVKRWPFKEFNFDLVIVDEVQDLSFNSIQVLTNLCLNNFMICGDNAQNIEKGINFKFKDLGNYLTQAITNRSEKIVDYGDYYNQSKNLPELVSYHLGLNFRSSKEILDVANLVVSLLETFFADEIDSFPKEKGFFASPKPVLAELGMDIEALVEFLEVYLQVETSIIADQNESMNDTATVMGKRIKNGSDFCVIVRDEQAKLSIPEALRNCIILTLQESKGLEFENVLLFNHFTGNDAEKGWRYIFNRTNIDERPFTKEERRDYDTEVDMFRRSKLEFRKLVKDNSENLYEFSTSAALEQISTQAQLEGLSADMKFLYVAITRAKKNLIIYDLAPPKTISHLRMGFDSWCNKLNLVEQVSAATIGKFKGVYAADENWKATQQGIARDKGYFFLKNSEYGSAERFFKVSNDERLVQYCKASEKAKMASDLLSIEFDDDLMKKYGSIHLMQKEAMKHFAESAEIFIGLDKQNEAGKCYFSAEDYVQAVNCFKQCDNELYLAHSLFMLKQYEGALPIYYKLEQDDLVQACLYNLSENGKDMGRFAALLASMSDEVKEVAKYDDVLFMKYIRNVFDEMQKDVKEAEELEELAEEAPADARLPQEEDNQGEANDEISEKPEADNSFVVVSDNKSSQSFADLQSLLSEIRSAGGSFERLPSLRSAGAEVVRSSMFDKVVAKLEPHTKRLMPLLQSMPGAPALFVNQCANVEHLIFDLATIFRFEDIGLEMLKAYTSEDKKLIFNRLVVNKLVNLDFNISYNKKVDIFKSLSTNRGSDLASRPNIAELVTLNIFDLLTAFKMSGQEAAFNGIDEIVKLLFPHVATMGLAEFFYSLTTDIEIRQQLGYLISKKTLEKLQSLEIGNFKIVNKQATEDLDLEQLSFKELVDQLITPPTVKLIQNLRSGTVSANDEPLLKTFRFVRQLFLRLAELNTGKSAEKEAEAVAAISGSDVWILIRLLRLLFKRRYFIQGIAASSINQTWLDSWGAVDGARLTLAHNRFNEFYFINSDSWLLHLASSVDDIKGNIKVEKDFTLYAMNREEDLLLAEQTCFSDFAFSLCVSEVLYRFKVKNQTDLVRLEVLSQLTAKDKAAIKFNKIYTRKAEDSLALFDLSNEYPQLVEDYVYNRTLGLLRKSESTKAINYFAVYQNFNLISKNLNSDKVVAGLIKAECSKIKESRIFFILDELDELLKTGKLSQAYFKLQDLEDYCEHNATEVPRTARDWLDLKEIFILVLAYCLLGSKPNHFNTAEGIRLPKYFRSELTGFSWIVEGSTNKYYIDTGLVSTDGLSEVLLNYEGKIVDLVSGLSKSVLQMAPELEPFIQDIINHSTQAPSPTEDNILIVLVSEPADLEVSRLLANHVEAVEKSDWQAKAAAKTVAAVESVLQFKKKVKNESSVSFIKKQQIVGTNRGKLFVRKQVVSVVEELYKTSLLRSKIIAYLFEVLFA